MRREYNFQIGLQTAEDLKFRVGSAFPGAVDEPTEVRGRDVTLGIARSVMLDPEVMRAVLEPVIAQVVVAIVETLSETPPELAADVMANGLMLAGGGALLPGLDDRLQRDTGLAVHVADSPLTCVALGAGLALEPIRDSRRGSAITVPR